MAKKRDLKKIVIGVPHTGIFNWQTVVSMLGIKSPEGYKCQYHFIGSCLVYDAREKIVEYMQNVKADYVLFLDSDMVPPHDIIEKLVNHDKEIITGMAFKRTPPFQPCFYTKCSITKDFQPILESPIEFPDKGLLEIEGTGMACTLIKKEVFDKIEKPWFFPAPNIGEDLTFCLKAKKQGIKMYVDLSVNVGHVGTYSIGVEHFKQMYENYKETGKTDNMFIGTGTDL